MIEVMNLHCFAPVFLLREMKNNCPVNLRDSRSTDGITLGPRSDLPPGLTYVDRGEIIGFQSLPQEILRSLEFVEKEICVHEYTAFSI